MDYLLDILGEGLRLLRDDAAIWSPHGYAASSLRLAAWSTAIALLLGLPVALWIAAGESRARRNAYALANAGLGLPPVGVGVYVFTIGPIAYITTFKAMVLAQAILALPIIVALSSAALLRLPAGLVAQARALGAERARLAGLMLREAKIGILAAVIVSMGAAIGEVGAVTIVHGSSAGAPDETLSMQIFEDAIHTPGGVPLAVGHTLAILVLLLALGALLTVVQQSSRWSRHLHTGRARDVMNAALGRVAWLDAPPRRHGPWPRWARWVVALLLAVVAVKLVGDAYKWYPPTARGADFVGGLRRAGELLTTLGDGDRGMAPIVLSTLKLAFITTGLAALVGVPLGCALGIARYPGRRGLLAVANGLARVPPVAVGTLIFVLFYSGGPGGDGPLAGLSPDTPILNRHTMAQTLIALPVVVALTAAAAQGVAPGLLEQARAFGAPGWRRGVLALREARRGVLAAIITAFGITITAVGALIVGYAGESTWTTLSLDAFRSVTSDNPDNYELAVAEATLLFVLFAVVAAVLTWLQREHGHGDGARRRARRRRVAAPSGETVFVQLTRETP